MQSNQTTKELKLDPMGHVIRPIAGLKSTQRYICDPTVIVDPATGSTKPDYSNKIDLVALIQTYKDQCGMELAKRLIKQGVDPAVFADDGKHSGDVTDPTLQSPQAIANAALANAEAVAQIKKALGLPDNANALSEEQLSTLVGKVIAEKYPNLIQPASPEAPKKGDAE